MSQSFIFDATVDSRIHLGGLSGTGHENPRSLMCIDVTQCIVRVGSENSQQAEVVQVWLTVPQVAEIVKQFFCEIVSPANIHTRLLERLLHRRYRVMTSEVAKSRSFGPEAGKPWMPRYDKPDV